MSQELAQKAKKIIEENLYIALATSTGDIPWNTPVYAIHDNQMNFYWKSWRNSNHSKNIRINPNTFGVIYNTTNQLGQNHRECLYIKGTTTELNTDEEIKKVSDMFPENRQEPYENFTGDSLKKLYKFTPEKIWLNNISEREVTEETKCMRIEVPIKDLNN